MRNLPVHWSEGMFLLPHHFQVAERYWTETLQTSEHWDHQYNYGIRQLEISLDALANYQVQLNLCHARMKDGTLIALDAGAPADIPAYCRMTKNQLEHTDPATCSYWIRAKTPTSN